jgi:hypothetical protein
MNFHNYQGQDYEAISSGIREDAYLPLAKGIMALRRPTTALTIDSQPLKRQILPYKVCYIIIYNGR